MISKMIVSSSSMATTTTRMMVEMGQLFVSLWLALAIGVLPCLSLAIGVSPVDGILEEKYGFIGILELVVTVLWPEEAGAGRGRHFPFSERNKQIIDNDYYRTDSTQMVSGST